MQGAPKGESSGMRYRPNGVPACGSYGGAGIEPANIDVNSSRGIRRTSVATRSRLVTRRSRVGSIVTLPQFMPPTMPG